MFLLLKMRRKWWVVTVLAAMVSSVGIGTIWSYVQTAQDEIGKQVRDAIPLTFELKRLENTIAELEPAIKKGQGNAAQLDVECEYLKREIAELEQTQADAKSEMDKLREALRTKQEPYAFGGQSFTRRQVEDDLALRLARYDSFRNRLEAKRRTSDSRTKALAAATEKVQAYRHERDLLVEKAESLQADLKLLELAQATGNVQFDHSKLQQAKDLAQAVEKRIRTLQKLTEYQQASVDEIPVEADTRSATEKFDEYFAEPGQAESKDG